MIITLLLRFLIGGIIVSTFAALGDALRPKTFAGLFGAAPSLALSSLSLVFATKGAMAAATEARSMLLGALALCAYSLVVLHLVLHRRYATLPTAALALLLWLGVALALWGIVRW